MASSARPAGRRILALWFPRLPTDRLQRGWKAAQARIRPSAGARSDKPAPPLVLVAKSGNALRLSAVDACASLLGLAAGMTLADARAMLPTLRAMPANEPADRALLERLADGCDRDTPFVACVPPHTLLLDITGSAHLFGGEAAMRAQICARLSRQGFTVRAALAGTAACARALARYRDGAIVPPHEEAAFVAPLPVEALDLGENVNHALRRAGLKTVGQVAARDRGELTARFGAGIMSALDAALGQKETPISPRLALPDYTIEHRFAEPVATHGAILGALERLAVRLSQTMESYGDGARRLEARFFRADGTVRCIALETGRPTRAPAVIQRLFRDRLEALNDPLDPGFGYDLIRLCASRAERADPEAIGFQGEADGAREIALLIDRMAARFGAENILTFRPEDTHIPEKAARGVPAQYASASSLPWEAIRARSEGARRPFRLFARPEPVNVIAQVPEGPPVQFRWRRALHAVVFAQGPERIAMEWWRDPAAQKTRDYFCVEDREGRRFWLYRSGLYGRETPAPAWFLHGIFA